MEGVGKAVAGHTLGLQHVPRFPIPVFPRVHKPPCPSCCPLDLPSSRSPPQHVLQPSLLASDVDVLRIAATVEAGSQHPLAKAILRDAEAQGLKLYDGDNYALEPGLGVRADVSLSPTDVRRVLVGNETYMRDNGVMMGPEAEQVLMHALTPKRCTAPQAATGWWYWGLDTCARARARVCACVCG